MEALMTAHSNIFVLVCTLIAAAGCEEPRTTYDLPPCPPPVQPQTVRRTPPQQVVRPAPQPPRPQPLVQALPSGRSVQGRAIAATAYGNGSQCIMVIGSIHGDEPAGAALCRQLSAYLAGHEELLGGLKVIIIPVANPDGLAAGTRANANGVDVNRNFATGNYTATAGHGGSAMSQSEAVYLRGLIDRHRPSRIITIHQPLACIDYDGPGLAIATAVGRASALPVKKLGARPGSLGSYAGVENNIPTVTVELPKNATSLSDAQVWSRYGCAMLVGINCGTGANEGYGK